MQTNYSQTSSYSQRDHTSSLKRSSSSYSSYTPSYSSRKTPEKITIDDPKDETDNGDSTDIQVTDENNVPSDDPYDTPANIPCDNEDENQSLHSEPDDQVSLASNASYPNDEASYPPEDDTEKMLEQMSNDSMRHFSSSPDSSNDDKKKDDDMEVDADKSMFHIDNKNQYVVNTTETSEGIKIKIKVEDPPFSREHENDVNDKTNGLSSDGDLKHEREDRNDSNGKSESLDSCISMVNISRSYDGEAPYYPIFPASSFKSSSSKLDSRDIEGITNRLALRERSKIFRRSEKKWHTSVNEKAYQMVLKDPKLLRNKKELRLRAEAEVRKTYKFAKGKSRSIALPENRLAADARQKQKLTNDKIIEMKRSLNAEAEEVSRNMRQCHMNMSLASQQSDATKLMQLRGDMQRLQQKQAKIHFDMDEVLKKERKLRLASKAAKSQKEAYADYHHQKQTSQKAHPVPYGPPIYNPYPINAPAVHVDKHSMMQRKPSEGKSEQSNMYMTLPHGSHGSPHQKPIHHHEISRTGHDSNRVPHTASSSIISHDHNQRPHPSHSGPHPVHHSVSISHYDSDTTQPSKHNNTSAYIKNERRHSNSSLQISPTPMMPNHAPPPPPPPPPHYHAKLLPVSPYKGDTKDVPNVYSTTSPVNCHTSAPTECKSVDTGDRRNESRD